MTTTTLRAITAEAAPAPADTAMAPGFGSSQSWDLAQRIGKAFAASSLVPEHYRGNLANCIVALEMANRMGASPLMVMQNLYIVHGNPGWSSKFLVACFNQSGRFTSLRYEWNEARTGCRAWAVEKSTKERIDGPMVTIEMAKAEGWSTKNGSKWKTMPELMLMYRAAAFLIRTYAPEISMGLSTDDELRDMVEAAPPKTVQLARLIAETPLPDADPDPETGEITNTPAAASGEPTAGDRGAGDTEGAAKPSGASYAVLAERAQKASDRDAALLVLDQARHLPADQQADLERMIDRQFG